MISKCLYRRYVNDRRLCSRKQECCTEKTCTNKFKKEMTIEDLDKIEIKCWQLEAENKSLKDELEVHKKALERVGCYAEGAGSCPYDKHNIKVKCKDKGDCETYWASDCWSEYFLEQAKKEIGG